METWETLTMSRKEVRRAGLLKAALAGKISNAQGAVAMRVSLRQFQRAKVRFVAEGPRGLLHRLRGRPAPRRLPAEVRTSIARFTRAKDSQIKLPKQSSGAAPAHLVALPILRAP